MLEHRISAHLIQPAFPANLRQIQGSTIDTVLAIAFCSKMNALMQMLMLMRLPMLMLMLILMPMVMVVMMMVMVMVMDMAMVMVTYYVLRST